MPVVAKNYSECSSFSFLLPPPPPPPPLLLLLLNPPSPPLTLPTDVHYSGVLVCHLHSPHNPSISYNLNFHQVKSEFGNNEYLGRLLCH